MFSLPKVRKSNFLPLLSTLVLVLSVFVGINFVLQQEVNREAQAQVQLQTANPNANPDTRKILNYLSCLPNRSDNRVISGQYTSGPGADGQLWPPNAYEDYVVRLYNETGKWAAMIGMDYSGVSLSDFSLADIQSVNQQLINHWNQGGLAILMWTAPNPWGGKVRDNYDRIDVTELITPGTSVNKIWMSMLDKVAKGLADLRDAGVVVLFRPFHEMNGEWFWWSFGKGGQVSPAQFTMLWRHMFDYFTYTKGLNNLIWAYGPDREHIPLASWQKPVLYYYPGDAYVDIVGLSVYSDTFDDWGGYSDLVALGKPFFFLEQGPRQQRCCGNWDTTIVTQSIKQRYPKITGFLFWSDWPDNIMSIVTNLNAATLMNDPWVITREEFNWSQADGSCPLPSVSPSPPTLTTTPTSPPPPSGANLVRNPSFESGTQDWAFHTDGVGTFTLGSPAYEGTSAAKVGITTPGTNVQLYQTGISLEANTAYTLSFAARSNTGHDVSVVIHQHGSPYTNYGLSDFVANLTSSWQSFSTTFTSTNSLPVNDARLRFWFAPYDVTGDEYSIDAVSLSKTTATCTLTGDINCDKVINILDFQLLSNNFGTTDSAADLNKDGTVNILDFQILSNNFGKSQ